MNFINHNVDRSWNDDDIWDVFDRTFKYDFAGRLSYNQFGVDAGTSKRVYEQSVGYDSYSNLTSRATKYWDEQNDMDAEFENGRITSDNTVVYDAAGNIVSKGTGATLRTDVFDASGRRTSSKDRWASSGGQGATVNERQTDHIVDGDGRPVIEKLGARQYSPTPGTLTMAVYKYQVWSTVLGKAVAVMDNDGNQVENRVYMGGTLLATSWGRHTTGTSADDAIHFFASDPVTDTKVIYAYNATTSNWASEEKEPFGQSVSSIDPYIEEWNNYAQVVGGAQDPEWQCTLFEKMNGAFDSMPSHCARAAWQADFVIERVEKDKNDISNIAEPSSKGSPPTLKRNTRTREQRRADKIAGDQVAATGVFDNEGSTSAEVSIPGFVNADKSSQSPVDYDEQIVKRAVKDAIEIASKKECDEALLEISDGEIPSLKALVSKYLDADGNLVKIADGRSEVVDPYGIDNPNIPAFVRGAGTSAAKTYLNSSFFTIGSGKPGQVQLRAILIIHESVHQFVKTHFEGTSP